MEKVPFVPADDLRRDFKVAAHFYKLGVPGTDGVRCRSVLEIRASERPGQADPDAVVVMMNPGKSKALDETEELAECGGGDLVDPPLVPAQPDVTQYQVMRVMRAQDWSYVRVINLSDLHESRSGEFYKMLLAYPSLDSAIHSVFSKSRSVELSSRLQRLAGAPVICAWGVSPKLRRLIEQAMNGLPHGAVLGYARPEGRHQYYHPLPRSQAKAEDWVSKVVSALRQRESGLSLREA